MRIDLDGRHLLSPADVYRALAAPLDLPAWFGGNPDALWDVLSERPRPDTVVVWHDAAASRARFGAAFDALAAALQAASAAGLIRFQME